MPFKSKFSMDDSIQIVAWWYESKDIHKVQWHYAKEKGIKKFLRKLPCDRKVKTKTLKELQEGVSDFVSINDVEVRRAVRDVRPRAELCVKMDGGHFDSQIKIYKGGTIEE